MATFEQVDANRPIRLLPYQHDLDHPMTRMVDGVDSIILDGAEAALFLSWATDTHWRADFEHDMQCLSEDHDGKLLLTTWMPLVTFRESFCGGGRQVQSEDLQRLMDGLRTRLRPWRDHGVDTVDVVFYRRDDQLHWKADEPDCVHALSDAAVARHVKSSLQVKHSVRG